MPTSTQDLHHQRQRPAQRRPHPRHQAVRGPDWALARDHRLSSGLAIRARSGEPINYWASDSGYGPQINLLLPARLGGPAALERQPRRQPRLPLLAAKARDLVFTIDVFNLLNMQARTGVDESYTLTAAQNTPGAPLSSAYTQSTPHRALEKADLNPNFLNPTKYQPRGPFASACAPPSDGR
jgi:hypothetical protein